MSDAPATGETFLVIGGTGFLGHNLASALFARGESKVHILDLRPASPDLHISQAIYHTADITQKDELNKIFGQVRPNAVFHTASPHVGVAKDVMEKVNVQGTDNIVEACKTNKVRKLIYTSSASVVFGGQDLKYVDERMPYAGAAFDFYSDTKGRAEQIVLQANTPDEEKGVPEQGLRTVSLRPAGIFGPNDRQAVPGFMEALVTGKHKYQLGDGDNLFDWTYIDNLTHAELLASDKLETRGYDVSLLADEHLTRALGEDERPERGVPTSEERQDVQGAQDYARELPSTLSKTTLEESLNVRPVVRNKYDQFFYLVHPEIASPGSPIPEVALTLECLPVAGEAFFITNGQPIPFWSIAKALWKEVSPSYAASDAKPWVISRDFALTIAGWAEMYGKLTGKKVSLTPAKTILATSTRYYNIEKARRTLGYNPKVSMKEGIRRSAQWWLTTPDGEAFKAQEAGKPVARKAT